MSRGRRIVRGLAIGAGTLVALIVLLAGFALFTTPGARLVLSVLNDRDLPFHARSIDGSLSGRFVLHDVVLSLEAIEATLDTVTVAWNPLALTGHRVHVRSLVVAGGRVLVKPVTADTTGADTLHTAAVDTSGAPWTIRADHLRVRGVSIDVPAGDVHLRNVDVAGSGGPDGYQAAVRASGSAWKLSEVDAFLRVAGDTRAVAMDTLSVRMLGGGVHGDAFLRWQPGLSWRARIAGESLRIADVLPPMKERPGPVSFRVGSTGLVHDDTTRAGIEIGALESSLHGRPIRARGRVDLEHGRVLASDVRVEWGSAHAEFSGSLDRDVADLTLDATVPALEELLANARGAVSVRGRVSGTPRRLDVDVKVDGRNVHAATIDLPDLEASLDATVSAEKYVPHAVDIRRATILAAGGRMDAQGTASWRDGLVWDGRIAAREVEVSTLTPARWNLRGLVSIDATTRGSKRGKRLHGAASIDSLSGQLRGRALRAAGDVAVSGSGIDLSTFRFAWGDTHLDADGHIGDRLDVRVDLVAPDLAVIDSSFAGGLSLTGWAKGPRNKLRVVADIAADSLRVREYSARRLEGHVDADLALESPADVRLLALDVARGDTAADSVRVSIAGPRDDQRARFFVAMDSTQAEVALRGEFADRSSWSGWIEEMRLAQPTVGEWRLHGRAPVFISRSRAGVDSLDLTSNGARLSLSGSWQQGDTTRADVALSDYPLSHFERYLAEGIRITGTASASASFTVDPQGAIRGRVSVVPGPGEFVLGDRRIAYEARATGRADGDGVSARLDVDLRRDGATLATVDATMAIPGFVPGRDSPGTQPVNGRLDVDCRNIAPVMALFAPPLTGASGVLTAHVSPTGTAEQFRLTGRIDLEDGRVNLPSGLRIRDADISLISDGSGGVVLDGAVTSGGGRVVIKAKSARSDHAYVNGTFTVKGERFQIVNQPEARVFVSPDIELQVSERVARATGRVQVPYARIEVAEVPASAVSASDDVVIVEDSLSTKPAWQVRTDVSVELGDSVTFSGFGLQARLAGNLAVHDERGQPTRGTGEIRILDGKYRAYGNELRIDQGRLVFGGGAIDDPGIDVRAVRGLTTQNVVAGSGDIVGVNLRGTLKHPQVSLFSNPPMSQGEIMSYLVLGRPMDTTGDQSALASAALLVGLQQGTGVAGDIGKAFSLDEAYIEGGSDTRETAFVAGKYLSPKLYVAYATGLFEKTNTFRVRYSLSRKWTLQAESGKESSTDLLYWFERGR